MGLAIVAKEREEKESLQQELDEANRMQSALLPLRSPKISWLDMAGASIPASEVGGDFFDYLIDEQKPKIAIADVSGKGLKAAMNAVMASGILNLSAQYQTVPSSIMSDMNNTLSQTMEQDMNVTMVLAQFDIQKKNIVQKFEEEIPDLSKYYFNCKAKKYSLSNNQYI